MKMSQESRSRSRSRRRSSSSFVKRPGENCRDYLTQILRRESDCKHHSIKLNRKHTFAGFQATKLYELPPIEAVNMLAVSDKLLFVLGRHGSIVAIDRENPEKVYRLKQQYSNHITGKIFYDEKTDCLLSYREWWCEPEIEEEDEDYVPVRASGYDRISLASIISENPGMGTTVMYHEENDSKNWEFDQSYRLIVAQWDNPQFHHGFVLIDMDNVLNATDIPNIDPVRFTHFKIGRSGNSTMIQYSPYLFLNTTEGNGIRVYRKKPFRHILNMFITPKTEKEIEIIIHCEMYIIMKRKGCPLEILHLRQGDFTKPYEKIKTNIFNVKKTYEHIGLCKTQKLLVYLENGDMGLCSLDNGILELEFHNISRNPLSNHITKYSTYITDDEDVMITTDLIHPVPCRMQGKMMITISSLDSGECFEKITYNDEKPSSSVQKTQGESLTHIVALTYDVKTNEIFTGNESGRVFKWSNK